MPVSVIPGICCQAREDIRHSLLILPGRSLLLPVVCLYALEYFFGPDAIWYAIPLGEGLAMVMGICFRLREKRGGKLSK